MLAQPCRYVGLLSSLPLNASLIKDQQDNNQEDQESEGSQGDTEVYVHVGPVLHSLNSFLLSGVIYKMRLRKKALSQINGRNTRQNPMNPNKILCSVRTNL